MKKIILIIVSAFSLTVNAQTDSTYTLQSTDKALSEVLKKALYLAEKTGEFAIQQAPHILQEFYAWHIWSSIMGIVFGLVLIISGFTVPRLWLSDKETFIEDISFFGKYGSIGSAIAYGIFVFTSVAGISLISKNTYDLVYILVAPKLYLIDYFI